MNSTTAVMTSTESVAEVSYPMTSAEQFFQDHGKDLKFLMAMAIGLKNAESNRFIVDEAEEVLKHLKVPETDYKPSEEIIEAEFNRRVMQETSSPPLDWWKESHFRSDWLTKNPIKDPDDVAFVKKTMRDDVTKDLVWTGEVPFLRLIHILALPQIEPLFDNRFYFPKSQRYKRHKSTAAMDKFLEAVTYVWNHPDYNPRTVPRPHIHERYAKSIPLDHALVANMLPLTPKKIEIVFDQMLEMLREPYYWSYSKEPNSVLIAKEQKFLESRPPYILYIWEFLVDYEIQRSFMHKIMFFEKTTRRKRKLASNEEIQEAMSDYMHELDEKSKQKEAELKKEEERRPVRFKRQQEQQEFKTLAHQVKMQLAHTKLGLLKIRNQLKQDRLSPEAKNDLQKTFQNLKAERSRLKEEGSRLEKIVMDKLVYELKILHTPEDSL